MNHATDLQSQRDVIGVCVGGGLECGASAAVEPGGAVVQQLEGGAVLQRRRERDPVPGRAHLVFVRIPRPGLQTR